MVDHFHQILQLFFEEKFVPEASSVDVLWDQIGQMVVNTRLISKHVQQLVINKD